MTEKIRRILSLLLIMSVIVSITPAAFAEEVPSDPEELMELFDERVTAPKAKNILSETETMVVQSKHGSSIYILSKPGGGRKLFKADEGATVTVYARQAGYALGIVEETSAGGWMNEKYLVSADSYDDGGESKIGGTGSKGAEEQIRQGLAYELGDGEKQDYVKAEKCYKKAMELGSTEAMARLALLYFKDDIEYSRNTVYEGCMDSPLGDERHGEQVFDLLTEAAEKGDAYATYQLAYIFYDDWDFSPYSFDLIERGPFYTYDVYDELDIERDAGTALDLYRKAFRKGSAEALKRLDEIYYEELSAGEEDGEAYDWLKARIKEKDPYAMYLYSVYLSSSGEEKDAEKYYDKARKAALKQKDPELIALFALLEYDSESSDNNEVFKLLEKAADAGGVEYVVGMFSSLFDEFTEELIETVFSIAMEKGNADELAVLGWRLRQIDWMEQCAPLAAECCLAAAEKGSLAGLLEMSCIITDMGMADPADWPEGCPERAFKVVLDAAKKDIFPWMCDCTPTIVWMYENGFGCKADPKEAEKWDTYITDLEESQSDGSWL